ncbi:hypothetical protein VCRA2128O305_10163 [Vibrio crassostreae]|nr:hypothetical protein VCRA2113O213_10162 [Vibrio crassostreae]CAK1879412.1 hypothetical protein VCRA2118O239_10484 [Vibrio crassostreae]CAK2313812.1 hypothetical protein VCRA2113O217_10484 [Vibrio crassostreae]CAK2334717.1 hypothetical protein VCRA2111O408_30064 [Vibrio crassostreae]CAK2362117.1 hypothetical protein VCRA2110O318_80183 [Vibrio crassostreae]
MQINNFENMTNLIDLKENLLC